ncbi:MAG: NADH-quinone oxidoreductase subunit N [Verrucomicrobia bacterium]|nr:NADH-quinone oxidoreductase subunit N [Verrucomicrobiota bacterium]
MSLSLFIAFLPELVLLAGGLVLFYLTLGESRTRPARIASLLIAVATIGACVVALRAEAQLFYDAYRVDGFSQLLKLVFAAGYLFTVLLCRDFDDIRADIRPEFYLFLNLSLIGFVLLVSSVDIITLVVSLELSSFPLFLLVAMRREREGQKSQMESAMKFMMFGVGANGIMLFGLSYLFGLTGTTSLPLMIQKLQPVIDTPLAIAGLGLTMAGLFYKLAVFPFHFWTPDVYQGSSNETAGIIASLPKVGAVVVLVRVVSAAKPDSHTIAQLLTFLAIASMFYGNLVALIQRDVKRLLGFSTIAHAGYTLLGLVALDAFGYAAALYYIIGYLFMVLACFTVVSRVSHDGANVALEDLAGLHKRSPLLTATLVIGVFALAGIPPFVGFMGKFTLLTAALSKGHLALVIIAVINAAIAVYYYLRIVREAFFRDSPDGAPPVIALDWSTRVLCVLLIAGIIALGVMPSVIIDTIASSVSNLAVPLIAGR